MTTMTTTTNPATAAPMTTTSELSDVGSVDILGSLMAGEKTPAREKKVREINIYW